MNLWFKYRGTFVCAPPKCGGTALYCAALGIDPSVGRAVYSTAQGLTEFYEEPGTRAVMAVRDPVDRFASLWRDKCRDGDANLFLTGMSPDALMNVIETYPTGNDHWQRQVFWYRPHVELVHFKSMLARLGLQDIRVNETAQYPSDPPMPAERIRRHYAQDVELCIRL